MNIRFDFGAFIAVIVLISLVLLFENIIKRIRKPKNIANYDKQPISDSESIGDVSVRLGEDIRDVWMKGYSDEQINGVLTGKYSLEEMYKMKPEGNDRS